MRRRRSAAPTTAPTTRSARPARASTAEFLVERVHCTGLRVFRCVFAAAMAYDAGVIIWRAELDDYFADPTRLHGRYGWPLPSVTPLSIVYMRRLPHLFIASAVCFGLSPRAWLRAVGLLTFVLSWGFLFLCDAARYVNHYWLYLLVAILLLRITCEELDVDGTPKSSGRRSSCRRVSLWTLRAQFTIIYLYAGLAKCNAEWIVRGEPLRTYLAMATADGRILSPLRGVLDAEALIAGGAAFSLFFDVSVGFALWRRSWFAPAAALAAFFHLSNAVIFHTIGSFPFVSLASCALFLPESAIVARATERGRGRLQGGGRSALIFSAAWVLWQALLPLRHHAHSSDVSWTKLANEFGWRLMADTTDGWVSLDIVVLPGLVAEQHSISPARVYPAHPSSNGGAPVTLTSHAIRQLCAMPHLLEQYIAAEHAAARAALGEPPALQLYAECWKSVNGRPYQRWCDPTFDWATAVPRAVEATPRSIAALPYALASSLLGLGGRPAWMLARDVGPWGAPSAADVAAQDVAQRWRARGYTVEAFSDAPHRPPWRDRILRSAGHREASLLCTFGELKLRADAPTRWVPSDPEEPNLIVSMLPGKRAELQIGRWHSIQNVGGGAASWLYAMR